MATHRKSVGVASAQLEDDDAFVFIFDRRDKDVPEVKIPTGGLWNYDDFVKRVRETIGIKKNEKFVIATTNREEIKDDPSWDIIDKGDTLYVLKSINQELCAPAKERVNFLPHYDTIVKGGMYEYYASEGQNPLPYAFAELIDNALSATANNDGPRKIELRLHFDEKNPKDNCIFVIDNGKGMTPRQLNNWAIYRLSKFIRKDKRDKVSFIETEDEDSNSSLIQPNVPLSLNSDISYFGVGGKQAVFFIGTSTRMISKARESKDVHELTISKEEFQQKELNQEAIYSGFIHNRKPGDASHISTDDEIVRNVIHEEKKRENFTVVQIKNINPDHLSYLKCRIKDWTRQLAHIYHYYIHGPQGNIDESSVKNNRAPSPFQNIDIEVKLFMPKQTVPQVINLRDIDDDMQTLYVRSGASVFDFKATVEGSGVVEGIIRYHPFLYDKETFPSDMNDPRSEPEVFDEHDYAANDRPGRGRRPIFECYWNGRLIPYTSIEDFEWCAEPKKGKNLPLECYNRISGVLFTNDHFQVSTNKLTFIDLEMRMKEKNTAYHRIHNGQEKRTAIDKEFLQWLKECHEHCDKQIHFTEFKGQVVRADLPKQRQTPWAEFQQVEWDGKIFKKGQLVRITRTLPTLLGTIKRFYLYGEYEGDVFATGGDLEVIQEPRSLYDEVKVVPLSKLDRQASPHLIKKYIEEEEAKLPSMLLVSWPEGFEVKQNESRAAGETVGAIKIEIANKKGETISKLPGNAASSKRLLVELKIIWHGPSRDEVIVSHISQYSKNWGYWFRKMENVRNLGAHTLILQVVLNESGNTVYSGKELPSHKIKFTVIESDPEKFSVGMLDGPFRIGVPFNIPLEFQDEFGNPAKPNDTFTPVLEASEIDISYQTTKVKGNNLLINGCVAKGNVGERSGKSFSLTVKIKQLVEASQTLKIRFLPGSPSLLVVPHDKEVAIENGNPVTFNLEVHDNSGNITNDGKLICTCKFSGVSGLPSYSLDCSAAGFGKLTGEPISLKKLKDFQILTAKIELQGYKDVKAIERKVRVLPSGRVSSIDVHHLKDNGKTVAMKEGETIAAIAGQVIQGLSFSLTDEAGRKVEIDDSIAAKIKVNWTPKTPKEKVIQGLLPDIRVPAITSDVKYCQISIQDGSGVDFNFIVSGKPAEPNQIKCKCEGFNVVKIGEVLASEIHVKVKDRFGNEISDLPKNTTSEFIVTGEGLNTNIIKVTQSKGTFVIKGIQFEGVTMGIKDVKVQWREHRDFVKIDVAAGPPAKLIAPGWDLNQPVTVLNDNKLPRALMVQVCDVNGNHCRIPDLRIQIAKDPKIKLMPAPSMMKTNPEGSVNFGILFVSGTRGTYEIEPKAMNSNPPIQSFKITIEIQPDTTKPVEMKVNSGHKFVFNVGDKLPDISVGIIAEDGNKMSNAKHSSLSMKLWKVDNRSKSNNTPASRATSYSPEVVKSSPGEFVFRDKKFPEQAGEYNVLITYYDGKHELFSNVLNFTLNPGKPTQLCPLELPGTPTVSNTRNPQSRILIRNTQFQLVDDSSNFAGYGYNGTLKLEICGEPGEKDLPCFVGGVKHVEFKFINGECSVSNVMLQENSSGRDGAEYTLKCQLVCDKLPKNHAIPPYNITFLFYNDAKKQSQMAALSKHRDELQTVIRTYKSLFETTEQLIKELKSSVHEAQLEENRIKEDLRRQKIPLVQLQSVDSVDRLISERTRQRENIMTAPRRICSLVTAPQEPQVLGKIGHLALVADTDIARVMSWHMSSDMDCVVTFTTDKAKELYRRTDGKQQVLPLDSIYRKTLPDWNKPLPHIKHKRNWRPPGNPMYARDLLNFPKEAESCKIVFGMLLGDTLILDNIDSANTYRQELVKFCHCPTILTRDGDRVRSNGKFGGLMNKALPIEKLRGAVFGEPLPNTFDESSTLISTVQSYKAALLRTQRAQEELQEQVDHYKDAEMQSKHKECREAEQQLKDVEYKLGVTMQNTRSIPPSRPNIQTKTNSDAPSPNKRARTSTVTPTPPTRFGTTPTPPTRSSGTTLTPPARIPTLLTRGSGTTTAPSTRGTGTTLTPPARTQPPSTRGSGTTPSPSTRSSGGTSQPSTRASGSTTNVPEDVIVISSTSASSVPSTPTRQSKRISSQTPTSNKRLRKT
ncbi:structural maintenance of chromosomes flexible hinge domain-containing protein 1-like [Mytilus edulis]|uniref:structural maintenance of chromosomes flexible hinge domain-containing protein 1-like n=1 Tax=Mytilus edulis TaxID=6550 RepID=UPI0039F0EEA8